jgi:Lrp/AsnC family transcriptional regulator, regulator for asnA, asnC and gidA
MPADPLDAMDRRILAALSTDGRRPYRDIARELDVSEGTVRQRVTRLVEGGLIRISAVGSPLRLGFDAVALVMIQVKPGEVDEVSRRLAEIPHVRFVGTSFGSADIVIQTIHRTTQELYAFISSELPKMMAGTILRTETFQLTNVLKSSWTWDDWWH